MSKQSSLATARRNLTGASASSPCKSSASFGASTVLFLFKSHPKPFFSLASAEDFSSAFATFDSFGDSAGGFSGLVSLESADGVGAGGGVLASGVVVDFVAGGADFSDFSAFGAFAAGGADFSF